MLTVRQVGLIICKVAHIDKKTTRGHFGSASMTHVRSIFEGNDDVEESVTRRNCDASTFEVKDKPEQV